MEEEFISQWGVYTGKYHLLINVPMAVSNALSSSLIPSVSRAVATGDRRMVKKKVAAAIRFSLRSPFRPPWALRSWRGR